jgi:hypothetical protein
MKSGFGIVDWCWEFEPNEPELGADVDSSVIHTNGERRVVLNARELHAEPRQAIAI